MDTKVPFVLISAELDELSSEVNAARTEELENELDHYGLNYKATIGGWNGGREDSFLVLAYDEEDSEVLRDLAEKFDQESILEVDTNRHTLVVSPDELNVTSIGTWYCVGKTKPDGNSVWAKLSPKVTGLWTPTLATTTRLFD